MSHRRSHALVAISAFLALLPTLAWLPTKAQTDPTIASAAAVEGYSNPAAYRLLLLWAGLLVAAGLFASREHQDPPIVREPDAGARDASLGAAPWIVLAVFLLGYFPFALARTGPYAEDALMLTVLHRMAAGQQPYLDFEFLYGPLLIYPAHWWLRCLGYSAAAYYAFYSLLQAGAMALLMATVVRFRGRTRLAHWWTFLLLVPFFLDTLLGINWFGLRRLLPLLLLLLVARDARRVGRIGVLGGLLLAYSHDYAVAALVAIGLLAALRAVAVRAWAPLRHGAATGAIALVTWVVVTRVILGNEGWVAYVTSSRELVGRFSAGEAGFRFYWTLNALALFGLLTIALSRLAFDFRRLLRREWTVPERLLLLGLGYALVLLKAGLNRADIFHLDPAFLGVVFAIVLFPTRGSLGLAPTERILATVLVVVAALTSALAQLPQGSDLARGTLRGMTSWLAGDSVGINSSLRSRAYSIMTEQLAPNPAHVALSRALTRPEWADRPVYFYGSTYALPPIVGAVKQGYLNDDFIYSDARGRGEWTYLQRHPDALVVISAGQWQRLLEPSGDGAVSEYGALLRPSTTKRMISVLSSVHLRELPDELAAREARWRSTVGDSLRANYRSVARFGRLLVLIRSGDSVTERNTR